MNLSFLQKIKGEQTFRNERQTEMVLALRLQGLFILGRDMHALTGNLQTEAEDLQVQKHMYINGD